MELETFISKTLIDIYNGVKKANEELCKDGYKPFMLGYAHTADETILFDVAVTASSERTKGGNATIKVFSLELGGKKDSSLSQEKVSRIQFRVRPDYTHFRNI